MLDRRSTDIELVLSELGYRLCASRTPVEAATIIMDVADKLIGWDACSVVLYSPETGLMRPVLSVDVVDGRRVPVGHAYTAEPPCGMSGRAISEGAMIVLREPPAPGDAYPSGSVPFGDVSRPSASLLYVPARYGGRICGVLSIQSYTYQAYTQHDLETLQHLADHCAGALERIRVEETLHASEDRLRFALKVGRMATWEWDLEANRISGSDEMYELFGVSHDTRPEMLDEVFRFVHPEDRETLELEARAAAESGGEFDGTFRALRGDGRQCWFGCTGRVVRDRATNRPMMVGLMVDITERKRLEDNLLQAQKIEGIGRLAGGVAHDFNNLLTAISGYAELAELELQGEPLMPGRVTGYVQQIRLASEHAAALTSQLLAFARKRMIKPRVASVNTLVVEASSLLRRLIGEDIHLITVPDPASGNISVDPGQFEQILVNLAVNARDAMPSGGTLTIETQNVYLDDDYARQYAEVVPGDYVMCAVTDTGIGMSPAVRARVFEPFFTTKQVGKGTGLGLATCHGIVKQAGGHIWVYSEPGAGTTFKVYLPRIDAPIHQPPPVSRAATLPSGIETVLVVEDEDLVRAMTTTALRSLGYAVLEAENGEAALEMAGANRIDLLVTDVVMPRMSGRELAEKLALRHPSMKVLYVSGYADQAVVRHGVLEEGIQFLAKPFSPRTLAKRVRDLLGDGEPKP